MTTAKSSGKPYWFELADADQISSRPGRAKGGFPFVVAVTAGVAILGGSLLLNTHEEPTANADVSTISTQSTTSSHVALSTPPAIHKSVTSGHQDGEGERENNDD